ncbi:MAG: class I SAM-dependent methyltransferase [SAR202 cluster bacterium]|nr:class I SAM-dependent methyltransferase [SAR202 cluster bacterium]MDP6513180.1 class I SAM-dependent methyltransferase [SAR202 cluster bacterium]MDP6716471.1 class I SAM-dependent methyltransferase [SAR202 cluster bacterium]
MKHDEDAFGHELFDFHQGQSVIEIIEREDGMIDTSGGPQAYFAPIEEWHPQTREAVGYIRGRVLDVGSGAGRIALYLQEAGHEVVCLDNSPLALEVCRARGVWETRLMSVYQVSRSLGTFDTIAMMGNNLGLLGDPTKGKRLLERFNRITSDRGRIVGECRDPYVTEDPINLEYHELNRQRGRMPGQVRIRVRYKKYKSPWFDYLFLSRDELRDILKGSPWRLTKTIDHEVGVYAAIIDKVSPGIAERD